ncbi:hypothetical protein [Corynebacterium coyleae]|uniref:hypothetical protein n=1 Tax=Corynebacterium coyleae TaxID=53374 RepID=UPI0025501FF7|nr:hypothetical protein [Corynebacterium coyleae]MDK8663912.1 hypothetical protein [Corynebacterium coyleae]MDK8706867.1 hypothetical protein [Corynebacterium coyleae]MDK8733714.1 hypothetical protein [Corynebacterium coyleae]MDK8892910.1 hypothetical protein [Corynebacterium coyleae]
MKTSRLLTAVVATTVAFSAVTPAQAAQIGPLGQNKCKVTFTAAEKSFLTSMEQDVASRLDSTFARDINLSLEAAYPSARPVGNDFVDANKQPLTGHTTVDAFDAAFNALNKDSYLNRLGLAGMNDSTANFYLKLRAHAAYGQNLAGGTEPEETDWDNYYVEARKKEGDIEGNFAGALLALLFGLTDVLGNEAQMEKFYSTFEKTSAGKYFEGLNAFLNANADAEEACLGEGNTTVAFPTKPASQPSKEDGSSTAGIVVGVIAAVLAVVGIAAAFAPQLGLQIPGLR